MSKPSTLIFQLGTNNWQREKKDGSGELEFAPGSGVLHEAHHNAYNSMPGVKSFSMYPSKNQAQPKDAHADYRVFELDHDIPICESASPNSSKRWHSMSDAEFNAYVKRLENEVYDYMKVCEAKVGTNFTMCIAHHSFINPLAMRRVIQRRVAEGLPKCPLYCFVHGTALKMYRWELGPKETEEQKSFPMRFHKMINEEKLFEDLVNGINACFVISEEQKGGIKEIFPMFPQERVIVAPNGINVEKFKPRQKNLEEVLVEQTREILWPAAPSVDEVKKYKRLLVFVGKYAEWKRQAALLYAMSELEKEFPDLALFCVGTGPDKEIDIEKKRAQELGLKNTFLLGARGQDMLAEMYTVASLGCFPSFKEPFGLVFVECMACKTPVIGANSGGPKDFVSESVGELVAEPPETKDLSTVADGVKTLGATLNTAISRALKEDWKTKKGEACYKLAHDKFTVGAQVAAMLKDVAALKEFCPPARTKVQIKIIESKIEAKRTLYVIKVHEGAKEWTTEQHYTEFGELDKKLEALGNITRKQLPEKGTFGLRHMLNIGNFNEHRQTMLQDYLTHLAGQLEAVGEYECVAEFLKSHSAAVALASKQSIEPSEAPEEAATAILKDLGMDKANTESFEKLAEKVFDEFDTDKSGKLEKKEIAPLLTKLSEEVFQMWKVKIPDIDESFKSQLQDQMRWELDSDFSGDISKEEFVLNIKKIVESHVC